MGVTLPPFEKDVLQAQFLLQFRHEAIATWLQGMTQDEIINLWWEAQTVKARKIERNLERIADINDMYGKSSQYIEDYYGHNNEQ